MASEGRLGQILPPAGAKFARMTRVREKHFAAVAGFLLLTQPFQPPLQPQSAQKSPAGRPNAIAYFVDEAAKAGLTAKNTFGGISTKKYIIETTGTGVAIFDYDNDGWPDI